MSSLRLDANFTEDTVGFALESFLSILSFPTLRFSIEPFSRAREHWLGADARLLGRVSGFRPFAVRRWSGINYAGTSAVSSPLSLNMPRN